MINSRYRIIKPLGQGRSRVFLCEDINRDIICAIKILPRHVEEYEKNDFREEYIKLKRFNSSNIIKSYDYGTVALTGDEESKLEILKGSNYFTLEYFEGVPINKFYVNNDEKLLTSIIEQICYTLFYIHGSNYIYYDLKPENILIKKTKGEIKLKLIDFGLCELNSNVPKDYKKGTAEYIAPEILQGEGVDSRVDLYSLGVVLYFLIYRKLPFSSEDELEIFNSAINNEPDYPSVEYSKQILTVLKKLLNKFPSQRYKNALSILKDLNIKISDKYLKTWKPVKTYVITELTAFVKNFVMNKEIENVLVITGSEGAGKTSISEEVYQNFHKAILINNNNPSKNQPIWKAILTKLLFADFIYFNLENSIKSRIRSLLNTEQEQLSEKLKFVFNYLSRTFHFILILDQFENYDLFTQNFIKTIMPLFVINKAKLIITLDANFTNLIEDDKSLSKLKIKNFKESDIKLLLGKSLSDDFPLSEINESIIKYSDLLPGNVLDNLEELFQSGIIRTDCEGVLFDESKIKVSRLKVGSEKFFFKKYIMLSESEKEILNIISAIPFPISQKVLDLFETIKSRMDLIDKLIGLNILFQDENEIRFASTAFNNFVYENLENKSNLHYKIANVLYKNNNLIDKVKLAQQFELAKSYDKVVELLSEEVDSAEKLNAYSYEKELLEHLIALPIKGEKIIEFQNQLTRILVIMGDYKRSNLVIEKLLNNKLPKHIQNELLFRKADCMTEMGEVDDAIIIYKNLLSSAYGAEYKNELFLAIASAETYINEFDSAKEKCKNLLKNKDTSNKIKAKVYNLLGIIELNTSNFTKAISYFQKAYKYFQRQNDLYNSVKILNNLGNINNILSSTDKANKYWGDALKISTEYGILEVEIAVLLSYGISFFEYAEFKKAEESYLKGLKLAKLIATKYKVGLFLLNIGELNIEKMEYEKAKNNLLKALDIFVSLNSSNEIVEIKFLLCKLYYILSNKKLFTKKLAEYERIVKTNNSIFEHTFYLEIFSLLRFDFSQRYIVKNNSIKNFLIHFNSAENKYQSLRMFFLMVRALFLNKKYNIILQYLTDRNYSNILLLNKLFEAEKYYWLGKISSVSKYSKLKSEIEYFEEAYELLENIEITELTWKVTFALAENFLKRGNINKAASFMFLTKEIINKFGNQISDLELRRAFYNETERKETLEKLQRWEILIK